MKRLLFFAVKDDLVALFSSIESRRALKYLPMGDVPKHESTASALASGAAIPNLGIASADSASLCQAFLACDAECPINLRQIEGYTGQARMCVDQLRNTHSVVVNPGGIWDGRILIEGSVTTASDSSISQAIMRQFQSGAKRSGFVKVHAYYVGPGALELLENGWRLTAAEQCPREYDLSLT